MSTGYRTPCFLSSIQTWQQLISKLAAVVCTNSIRQATTLRFHNYTVQMQNQLKRKKAQNHKKIIQKWNLICRKASLRQYSECSFMEILTQASDVTKRRRNNTPCNKMNTQITCLKLSIGAYIKITLDGKWDNIVI